MTTLLISENFPPRTGGSSRWFWEIYRRLPRERFVIAAGEDSSQEAFDQTHDLRLTRLPLTMKAWGIRSVGGLWAYGRAIRKLRRLVLANDIDRIHCGRCLPEGVMALVLSKWFGLPYACFVHGEDVTTAAESREHSWLVRRVLGTAEFVVANSRNTAQILQDEWDVPEERIRLLHPGVDTMRFVPAARSSEVRARLGWGERTVVLTVGRLQKRKGHDILIRALPVIRGLIPNVLYAVVGDGEERRSLEELARCEGVSDIVHFHGEISDEDLVHSYQQCDLFVLPNRQVGRDIEGFGMVLLEAQACGRAVVAGASGGTAETMRVGETGRVVCCDEPHALAALIVELLTNRALMERMGEAAREWTVERFDWNALSRKAECIFRGDTESPSRSVAVEASSA